MLSAWWCSYSRKKGQLVTNAIYARPGRTGIRHVNIDTKKQINDNQQQTTTLQKNQTLSTVYMLPFADGKAVLGYK